MNNIRKVKRPVEISATGEVLREIEFTLRTFVEDGREALDEWYVEERITVREYDMIRLWADDFGNMNRICTSIGIVPHPGLTHETLDWLIGRRVVLEEMPDDPCPILPGSTGTVTGIDDMMNVRMRWDDGRTLSLLPGIDKYHII